MENKVLNLKNVYIYNKTLYTKEPVERCPEFELKLYSEIDFNKKQAIVQDGNCLYTKFTGQSSGNIAHYFQDVFYLLHSVINHPKLFNCEEFTDIIIPPKPRGDVMSPRYNLIRSEEKGELMLTQLYSLTLFQSLISSKPNINLNKLDHNKVYFYNNISFIVDIDRWMTFEVDGKNLIGEIRDNMLRLLQLGSHPTKRKNIIIHDSQLRGKDLINLDLLIDELVSKKYNVIVHKNFNDISIKQQIQDYYNADILISPCGANMINCIFSKNIKKILCLGHQRSPKYHDICHWWTGSGDSISTFFKDIDIAPKVHNIVCQSTNAHTIKKYINGGLVPNLVLDIPKILNHIEIEL